MGNEKYTQKVIEAFQSAQQIAALHYNQELSSVHMLMGLTKEPEGLLNTIFSECHTALEHRLQKLSVLFRPYIRLLSDKISVAKGSFLCQIFFLFFFLSY